MDFPSSDMSSIDVSMVCRGCLASGGEMKNMIEWGLVDNFHRLTHIQVDVADGLSQLICGTCEDVLLQLTRFTSQCKQSDEILKSAKEKNVLHDEDVGLKTSITTDLQNDKLDIMVVAPDTSEKITLPCPYCSNSNYIKKSDLQKHIQKEHNLENYTVDVKYHCHKTNCSYNLNSKRHKFFTSRKNLNQHVNKVHSTKNFTCSNCPQKFATESDLKRHTKTCNYIYECHICNIQYKTNETLLVHLLRKHPKEHKDYKEKKAEKRKVVDKKEEEKLDYCDSPKRSFATQTLENIKNDVTFWQEPKRDEISTQTVFEDLLSLKSQMNDDDSLFFSETVSLSDIQTQTIPFEFGLCRSDKETVTSETQSPDFSIKETQTCFCHFDSPKPRFESASPFSLLTSTETQTLDSIDHDVLLNCAETQTCFDSDLEKKL
ncbi:telomere zinc finger-associated protein-like [Aricia agestis]|uniref:telomere zinc finger-associated protein-like n=1 Tax=Aricia agestis TaxID=91739 RepID=UPI001C209F9C|nr:telomere zinc finger-associated protein-like [Aricia agestis]